MADLLTLKHVSKQFGGLQAVNKLNLHVNEGEIVGLIGPNGSGKSTLLNLISGIYEPDCGVIELDGRAITGLPPYRINRMGIARTFQNLRLFLNLSVLENVMSAAYQRSTRGLPAAILRLPAYRHSEQRIRTEAEELLSFFGTRLTGYRHDQPAYTLSYANRRRLEIARALMTHPRVLLLDEPAAGMNPYESAEIAELVVRIRDQFQCAVLLVEHDMKVIAHASERLIALDYGQISAQGDFQSVTSHPAVVESYLGKAITTEDRPEMADVEVHYA
ncbi:MAG: ABC transporter ATP-binding protein [Anaerolineae bacterium]|nr:ABC transporter ATP-binding protein [Anaerolineae bacterium]MCA9907803.1 ABC transporter ATP-binding protein [Anaerolineae bacterium]